MDALVYINHGRVIVDCPTEGCGNAYLVSPGEKSRTCDAPRTGCQSELKFLMPGNVSELMMELDKRPNKANRNWFPEGHPIALRGGHPMKQSVADLASEFRMERERNGMD